MGIELSITPQLQSDIEAMLAISTDQMAQAIKTSESSSLLRPEDLVRTITKVLEQSRATTLVRLSLSLRAVGHQSGVSIDEVVEGLRNGLFRERWDDEKLKSFDAQREQFVAFLKSPNVRRISMALSLSYEHAHFFQSARIITDIRPIYDDSAISIEGAVVSHTLRLRYDGLSLALDLDDIVHLRDQCDRALEKARVAYDLMEKKAGVVTMISGDKDEILAKK